MFHTWAITTGQKMSKVIAVGIACCPKIPMPASTLVPFIAGSISMFRAVLRPTMALKMPPLRMLTPFCVEPAGATAHTRIRALSVA